MPERTAWAGRRRADGEVCLVPDLWLVLHAKEQRTLSLCTCLYSTTPQSTLVSVTYPESLSLTHLPTRSSVQ